MGECIKMDMDIMEIIDLMEETIEKASSVPLTGKVMIDKDEFLEVFRLPLSEAIEMILRGEIPDGKTQTAILRAKLMLERGI